MRADLNERAAHLQIRHDLARDGACRNPHRRLARRLAAAATIIAQAIFDVVGIVGVAGPIFVFDVGIIFAALIDVVDHERNRRASGNLLAAHLVQKHAGQDFDRVRFLALRGETRLAGTAPVEIGLDVGLAQRNARRTTIDNAADGGSVALAEGRHPK